MPFQCRQFGPCNGTVSHPPSSHETMLRVQLQGASPNLQAVPFGKAPNTPARVRPARVLRQPQHGVGLRTTEVYDTYGTALIAGIVPPNAEIAMKFTFIAIIVSYPSSCRFMSVDFCRSRVRLSYNRIGCIGLHSFACAVRSGNSLERVIACCRKAVRQQLHMLIFEIVRRV